MLPRASRPATCARLLPHLEQAVALGTTLQSLRTQAGAFADALHASGAAMILLDRDRRVAFMIEAAERIVARADGLHVDRQHRLRASSLSVDSTLQRLLATVGYDPRRRRAARSPSRGLRVCHRSRSWCGDFGYRRTLQWGASPWSPRSRSAIPPIRCDRRPRGFDRSSGSRAPRPHWPPP